MYEIGELIIYGNTGVCQVEDITTSRETPEIRSMQSNVRYYILKPIYQKAIIYTPVGNPKVFMRKVISKEKAASLISLIPTIEGVVFHSAKTQELKKHYELAMSTYDCLELIKLSISISAKRQSISHLKRKLGQVDEHYMKRADDLLYGEFAVALDMPIEDVTAYLSEKMVLQGSKAVVE